MFSRIFIVPLFIISLWNLPLAGHTQGEFNKWYFGVNAGIDFNSTPPVGLSGSAMNTMYTSACVTDSLGNLLFYSQGLSVYNRNHQVMPNGNGLFGGQNTQGVFAVKKPGSENLYFLFTVYFNLMPLNYGLYYSLIDMNLNGGIGDVVSGFKNIPVAGGEDVINGIHGARHFNNKDAWIVVRKTTTNEYAAYRVTSSGISSTPVLSSCSVAGCGFYSCGYVEVKISQDGTRYVFVSNNPQQNMHVAEVGLFNCNTGVLTPLFQFRPVNPLNLAFVDPRNIEFSPDSKRLYVATTYYTAGTSRFVFQYDLSFLDSTQFMQSQLLISSTHEGQSLQLGSDGKIYQTSGNVDSLNVINNPNVHGLGCNFQTNAISLANGTFNHSGLPQFLQRYKAYIHSFGNCQNDSVHFSADIWPLADTTRWNFGDPASDAGNISTLTAPAHLYANPGTYMVTLYVRHNDNRTDTTWRTITIDPSPAPSLGTDRTICTGNTAIFDAGFCSGCTYEWKNVGSGLIVGTTQTFTTGTAGFYGVIVTNTNGCTGSDTVQLITTIIPAVNNDTLAKTICSGASTNIPLTGNVPEVMFHWTATLTAGNISGFSADSGLAINQTLINNGATAGVVAYHITPKIGDCAGANVEFPVTVNIGDPVDVSITASGNTVCAGTTVTFTATAVNPGASPVYQWKVNGANSGSNAPTFAYFPGNGDIVKCVLTSSNTICTSNNPATSNSITMVVNPLLPVSVSISPSSNPVCAGTPVNFNAIPINGGTTPQYQWKVNGLIVGTNSPNYSYMPVNGDAITCTLNSNVLCSSGNPAISNEIAMTVNLALPAAINILASANPFCPGSAVTFTATPSNGGTTPMYQWKVNSILSIPSILPIYTYSPNNSDTVNCIMTSNLSCVTGNPATSAKIIMSGTLAPIVSFAKCFDTVTTVNAKPFKLKGGLPLGGTFSGPGVNSITGTFTPSIAGTGLKTINYSYTNVAACSAAKSKTILVLANPAFICGNTLTDIRDGKSYPTVLIGTQCWMSSNLDFGFPISDSTPQTDNCISEKYARPHPRPLPKKGGEDGPSNVDGLYAFYQWDELMSYSEHEEGQGLCPPGWHVPKESEWTTLFDFYQGASKSGSPLQDSIINGFKALRSGVFYLNSSWSFPDFATVFWSSTSSGQTKAISHGMNLYNFSVSLYPASRGNAFSARCLRDQ